MVPRKEKTVRLDLDILFLIVLLSSFTIFARTSVINLYKSLSPYLVHPPSPILPPFHQLKIRRGVKGIKKKERLRNPVSNTNKEIVRELSTRDG